VLKTLVWSEQRGEVGGQVRQQARVLKQGQCPASQRIANHGRIVI
jgi:hypothetical protein